MLISIANVADFIANFIANVVDFIKGVVLYVIVSAVFITAYTALLLGLFRAGKWLLDNDLGGVLVFIIIVVLMHSCSSSGPDFVPRGGRYS